MRMAGVRIILAAVLGLALVIGCGGGGSAVAASHDPEQVPQTGQDLRDMHVLAFVKYLLGVYDGQDALVKALDVDPVVCLEPLADRDSLHVLAGALKQDFMKILDLPFQAFRDLPAGEAAFRLLAKFFPCRR